MRRRRRETIESRFRRLKLKYAINPPKRLQTAVIECSFWNGLTDGQTAEILGTTKEIIAFEVDALMRSTQARLLPL